MRKGFHKSWLGAFAVAACAAVLSNAALAQDMAPSDGSFSAGIKSGWQKITKPFTPEEKPPEPEAVDKSLSLKEDRKPKANVYVAVAHLYEQSGNYAEAEKQYQAVLKDNAKDIQALNGYARLKEHMGLANEAINLYQQAVKINPRDAGSYNNLGLCFARNNQFDDAVAAVGRAILLQPRNVLYRNNMATILVDRGKYAEAFSHLRAVHSEAAAYYNMGFLLNRKGKKQEAAEHFSAALRIDPNMTAAQNWLDRLQQPASAADPAGLAAKPPQAKPPQANRTANAKPATSLAAERAGLPGWQGGSKALVEEPTWPARSTPLVRLPSTAPRRETAPNGAIEAAAPVAPLPPETTWRPGEPSAGAWR